MARKRDLSRVRLNFVETLDDVFELKEWMGRRRNWLGFDIETSGPNAGSDVVRLAQVGDTETGWAIPWDRYAGVVHELLGGYDRRVVAHNVLFDSKFLAREGISLSSAQVHDSMIMAHLHNPMISIGLKPTSDRMYGPIASIMVKTMHAGMKKQGWTWATVPLDYPPYWQYGALDPVLCACLAEDLWPKVQDQRYIYDVELGCIRVLRDAELAGVRVDLDYVAEKRHEKWSIMEETRPQISPEIRNPNSDDQVIAFLQRRGARLWKTTDRGNLSCDDSVLKEQEEFGIEGVAPIRAWRRAYWLDNSHFKSMQELNVGGVLRASVKPVGAKTGRMSIEKPALQTIPRGPEVRDAFIAREGHSLIFSDYEQAELRGLAHFANEETMLQAFEEGYDFHDFVASEFFGQDFEREDRQVAKNANFAKAYCSGVNTFAHTAGIPVPQAQSFMDEYDRRWPGVQRFQQETIDAIHASNPDGDVGYVTTILGRKIPVRKSEAYKGVNYVIQSSMTADLPKLKIIELSNAGLHDMFRLAVHDELMFEVEDDIAADVKHTIDEVMPETQLFRCAITSEADVYKRWGDKYR